MLILTRRPGERVVIGEDVLITVMGVSGQTVRLGIAAPEGLPIYREEIWLAVKEENRAAAAAAPDELPGSAEAPPTPSPAGAALKERAHCALHIPGREQRPRQLRDAPVGPVRATFVERCAHDRLRRG